MKLDIENLEKELKAKNDNLKKLEKKVKSFQSLLDEVLDEYKKDVGYSETLKNVIKLQNEIEKKKQTFLLDIYCNLKEIINKGVSYYKIANELNEINIEFNLFEDFEEEEFEFDENEESYFISYESDEELQILYPLIIPKDKVDDILKFIDSFKEV